MKITTRKQFEKMVELLEKKPELAQSYHNGLHKVDTKAEWIEISKKLNTLGPPSRTGPEWMKVWADYKSNLKKKLLHNKTEWRATGGGLNSQYILTPIEEAASALLQLNSIISPDGEEIGISSSKETGNISCIEINESDEIFVASTSKNIRRKVTKNVSAKQDIIEQQLKVQTELYNEVKDSLKQIERYARKQHKIKEESLSLYNSELKIKKEKFELYKKETKKKNDHRRLMLQLRTDEIDIKKRRLELDEYKNRFNQ